ncbi:MAG: hypothetical protein BRD53_02815 [Bacteroidetes bacterium SW_7_64_58]|nr:MAG: hypothetical protein BRD53_02815 [Bacteroidetes bacterium SW_7_64_58]
MPRRALALLVGLLLGACGSGASDSNRADTTYGAPIDATDAMPAPAVAAEDSLYLGHRVTIDGRITAVWASGCDMQLATDATPLVVAAPRTDAGDCAWQLPSDAQDFAVAAGTLRTAEDTLRLTANGVRVTPVRVSSPDS